MIPPGLNRAELIKTAQKLHDDEPNTNLILVDDESGLADYVEYAKAASKGNMEAEMPKEWADKHIVGNVQKWMSGEWFLCESNGYEKIAALE